MQDTKNTTADKLIVTSIDNPWIEKLGMPIAKMQPRPTPTQNQVPTSNSSSKPDTKNEK